MSQPGRLEFPLAKAEYLLTRAAEPGQGGDKQNFWRGVMGFESAVQIREAVLAEVATDLLQLQGQELTAICIEPIFVLQGRRGCRG